MSLEVFGDEGFIGVCAACGEESMDCQCLDEPCELGTHVWTGQQQRLFDQQGAEAGEMQDLLFTLIQEGGQRLEDVLPAATCFRLWQWWEKYRPSATAREE